MVLCSIALHANVVSGTCGDNLTWSYDTDTKALTIEGTGDMSYNEVPWAQVKGDILSVSLPEGLTSIEWSAFNGCSSLTSIILPNSVTSIRDGAFQNCSSLTDIYCYATTPPVSYHDDTFKGVNTQLCYIHVPAGTIRAYRWAHMWKKFYNLSEISEETAISNK